MRAIRAVVRRELASYFGSWTAYVLIAVYLVLSGYFFYSDLAFFVTFGAQNLATGLWRYVFIDYRLVTLLVLPPVMFLLGRIAVKLKKHSGRAQERLSDITERLQETIGAVRVVKAFANEDAEGSRFRKATRRYRWMKSSVTMICFKRSRSTCAAWELAKMGTSRSTIRLSQIFATNNS